MSFDFSYKGSVEKILVYVQQAHFYKMTTQVSRLGPQPVRRTVYASYLSFFASLFASFTSDGTNFLSSLHFWYRLFMSKAATRSSSLKRNFCTFPWTMAGTLPSSFPSWNMIMVGSCLESAEVLMWYCSACSGYLPTSTFPNFKLGRL